MHALDGPRLGLATDFELAREPGFSRASRTIGELGSFSQAAFARHDRIEQQLASALGRPSRSQPVLFGPRAGLAAGLAAYLATDAGHRTAQALLSKGLAFVRDLLGRHLGPEQLRLPLDGEA